MGEGRGRAEDAEAAPAVTEMSHEAVPKWAEWSCGETSAVIIVRLNRQGFQSRLTCPPAEEAELLVALYVPGGVLDGCFEEEARAGPGLARARDVLEGEAAGVVVEAAVGVRFLALHQQSLQRSLERRIAADEGVVRGVEVDAQPDVSLDWK